jgi:polysaccharide pyruvyl transferase WcaK-like protein
LREVHENAVLLGRSTSDITAGLLAIWYKLGTSDETNTGARRAFTGSSKEIIRDVEAYRKKGLQCLIIGGENSNLEACLHRMREFKTEIIEHL